MKNSKSTQNIRLWEDMITDTQHELYEEEAFRKLTDVTPSTSFKYHSSSEYLSKQYFLCFPESLLMAGWVLSPKFCMEWLHFVYTNIFIETYNYSILCLPLLVLIFCLSVPEWVGDGWWELSEAYKWLKWGQRNASLRFWGQRIVTFRLHRATEAEKCHI